MADEITVKVPMNLGAGVDWNRSCKSCSLDGWERCEPTPETCMSCEVKSVEDGSLTGSLWSPKGSLRVWEEENQWHIK